MWTPDDVQAGDDSSPGELLGDGTVSSAQAEAIAATWEEDCVDLVAMLVRSGGSEIGPRPRGPGVPRATGSPRTISPPV